MSFSDLLSSGRGPGIIGMVVATLVLGGFGLLFMLSFDEAGGGRSLAWEIQKNNENIDKYNRKKANSDKQLELLEKRTQISSQLVNKKADLQKVEAQMTTAISNAEAAEESFVQLNERFFDYKNQYRAFVRGKAEGTVLETLETKSGEILYNVHIKNVTPVGMELRHRDGLKRLPFEELPDEMQDYYQFDNGQKEAELMRELEMRKKHNKAVELAKKNLAAQRERQKAADAIKNRSEATKTIAILEQRIIQLQSEVTKLNVELSSENTKSQYTSKITLSNSGSIRNKIASKNKQIATMRSEIGKLRASTQ